MKRLALLFLAWVVAASSSALADPPARPSKTSTRAAGRSGSGDTPTALTSTRATVAGPALSKEEIGATIRRSLPRFTYCYERELTQHPELVGKVSVYFAIGPEGRVASATIRDTTMNNATVEACLLKVMQGLTFPRPRNKGIVTVTYPFVFERG